jgi:hypothetical protein
LLLVLGLNFVKIKYKTNQNNDKIIDQINSIQIIIIIICIVLNFVYFIVYMLKNYNEYEGNNFFLNMFAKKEKKSSYIAEDGRWWLP